jgi:hypothetical protein
MGASTHPDSPQHAGDYVLDSINLIGNNGDVIDIKGVYAELNIHESIYNNSITGSIVITDSLNIISRLPLQGTERIAFKLLTPGAGGSTEATVDASIKTGTPFHIYKLSDREQLSEGITKYILHFCSRGMVRNIRTRVSQAYTGPLHEAVANICTDKSYLDCRKKLYFEPTRNKTTIVIPNMRPLDAVNLIAQKSLSGNSKSAGYYFYETVKGYYFRSWESMIATQGKLPRKIAARFDYVIRNVDDKHPNPRIRGGKGQDKHTQDMEAVRNYSFVNNYDSMAQQAMGTYAHRVITHNIYDKSYDIEKYNYHTFYADHQHADIDSASKYPIMDVPVDFDQKSVSNYDESLVTLQPTTQYLHNDITGPEGTDVADAGHTEATRVTQANSVGGGIKLHLEVNGHSWLQAGDVIFFQLRTVEPDKGGSGRGTTYDSRYAGRYVITNLRHRVTDDDYILSLDCVKDSTYQKYDDPRTSFPPEFYAKAAPGRGSSGWNTKPTLINIYNLDRAERSTTAGHHQ